MSSYIAPAMRFSKSTRRGEMKAGWVCESTNPGSTTRPPQSNSTIRLPVLPDPGIAQCVFRFAGRNNSPARAKHCTVFDNAQFAQVRPTPRPVVTSSQRQQLPDVHQQQRSAILELIQSLIPICKYENLIADNCLSSE
jgi:hypothetical protein